MNTRALFRLTFHVVTAIVYFAGLVRYEYLPPMPHKRSHEHFAGRWKYLTYWNLIAQFLFFAFSTCIDVMKSSSSTYHKAIKLRDKLYAGIVLPYGVFVVAVFWILYSIDRELIFPRILDSIFPSWLNHVSHTVILPVLLIETYILKHRHPRKKDGIAITVAFGIAYISWVLYLALVMDIWPYPILQIMDWSMRIFFFGGCLLFLLAMYLVGERINCTVWGEGVVMKNR